MCTCETWRFQGWPAAPHGGKKNKGSPSLSSPSFGDRLFVYSLEGGKKKREIKKAKRRIGVSRRRILFSKSGSYHRLSGLGSRSSRSSRLFHVEDSTPFLHPRVSPSGGARREERGESERAIFIIVHKSRATPILPSFLPTPLTNPFPHRRRHGTAMTHTTLPNYNWPQGDQKCVLMGIRGNVRPTHALSSSLKGNFGPPPGISPSLSSPFKSVVISAPLYLTSEWGAGEKETFSVEFSCPLPDTLRKRTKNGTLFKKSDKLGTMQRIF